jgi:hypothetical protein
MTASDSKGGGKQGSGFRKTGGSNLKLPRNDSFPVKVRDGSHLKVPPKPSSTTKPDKE